MSVFPVPYFPKNLDSLRFAGSGCASRSLRRLAPLEMKLFLQFFEKMPRRGAAPTPPARQATPPPPAPAPAAPAPVAKAAPPPAAAPAPVPAAAPPSQPMMAQPEQPSLMKQVQILVLLTEGCLI